MDFLGVNRRRSTSADSRQTRRRRCCTLRSSRSATSSTSRCRPIRRARALTRALRSSRLRHQKQRSTLATTCTGIASRRSRTGGGSSRSTRQSRQRELGSTAATNPVSSLCTGHYARAPKMLGASLADRLLSRPLFYGCFSCPPAAHRQSGPRRSGSQHTALMESANPALERRQRTATRLYKKRREPSTRESRSCSHHLVVTSDARTPGTIRRTWRPKREREKERRCKCECDVGE